jgi:DNA-binding GntR family transcriptional regulator
VEGSSFLIKANIDSSRLTKKEIYREIRERICLLDYAPGYRLNERKLALEFSISRTPMRDVLQRLEHDGLIESKHGLGTLVTTIKLEKVREIYLIRMRLADAIGDLHPIFVSDDDLKMMRQIETACVDLVEKPSKRQFAIVNIRYNSFLHNLPRNETVRKINDNLFFQSARFWFLLLDDLDFSEEAIKLMEEVRMSRQVLELGDIRLLASIHKTHLNDVLARVNKIVED